MRAAWPELKARLTELFRTKTRDEWCAVMEHTDVCFAPVLRLDEAARHPHNIARATFVDAFGALQPAPAPRFSRTVPELSLAACPRRTAHREVLEDWGIDAERIDDLLARGAVKQA